MDIKNVRSDKSAAADRPVRPATPVSAARPADASARDEGDRIEISAEARALGAQLDSAKSSLSPERLAELRAWIENGEFDRPEVMDAVARRMLERGDI